MAPEEETALSTFDLSADLVPQVRRRFSSPSYQPPELPEAALELVTLSQRANVGFPEIVEVLGKDPWLVGHVMARLQSPLYTSRSPIRTLKDAVVRLGLLPLRDIVFEFVMNLKVFRSEAYNDAMERLRVHSLATAHAARLVSRHAHDDAEHAYLCGLLHDIGVAGAFLLLAEIPAPKRPSEAALWPELQRSHEKLGGIIASRWRLPADVQLLIGNHHRIHLGGAPDRMTATLAIAELLTAELGASIRPNEPDPDAGPDEGGFDAPSHNRAAQACALLSLAESDLDAIRRDLEAHREELGLPPSRRPIRK